MTTTTPAVPPASVPVPAPTRRLPSSFRLRGEMSPIAEAPGKVWFWELAAAVIDADRCVQCGACVAACPTDSIGVGPDGLPRLVKMCTGCSLCWDFCPRGGLRYESTWIASDAAPGDPAAPADRVAPAPSASLPGPAAPADRVAPAPSASLPGPAAPPVDGGWRITGADPAPGLGAVMQTLGARVRARSTLKAVGAQDGGVVSAILLSTLAAGEIDGAVVAREDPDHPWKGVPHLATTADSLRESAGSFYNQTMALASLDLESAGLGADSRIALVGTPCEIQGLKALQARAWRRGSSRVDSVVLTIALLCTKSFDYEKLMLREIAEVRGLDLGEVAKVDVIHGRLMVFDREGAPMVDEPVKEFHRAALKGCDECADFLGRAADLSVGSVGSDAGYSSVLVRTEAGRRALELTLPELETVGLASPESLERLDKLDKKVARSALKRELDPEGPLFVDFEEHVTFYGGTDRAPVWR